MRFIILAGILHILLFFLFSKYNFPKKIEKKEKVIIIKFENLNVNNSDVEDKSLKEFEKKVKKEKEIGKEKLKPTRKTQEKTINKSIEKIDNEKLKKASKEFEKKGENKIDKPKLEEIEKTQEATTNKNIEKVDNEKLKKASKEFEKKDENKIGERKLEGIGKIQESKNNSIESLGKSEDLLSDGKGGYIVKNQGIKGLKYNIRYSPNPEYPEKAKRVGYDGEMVVKVRFLVNENGEIEDVKFYTPKDKLGFQDEVRKVIYNWKFSPIKLNGKAVKLYFYKTFRFNQI